MGLKNNGFATVWEHEEGKGNFHTGRISTSRKIKDGEYMDDFSAYVHFVGKAKDKISKLPNEMLRIKVLSFEVNNKYDKEKQQERTYYAIFDFEVVEKNKDKKKSNSNNSTKNDSSTKENVTKEQLEPNRDEEAMLHAFKHFMKTYGGNITGA